MSCWLYRGKSTADSTKPLSALAGDGYCVSGLGHVLLECYCYRHVADGSAGVSYYSFYYHWYYAAAVSSAEEDRSYHSNRPFKMNADPANKVPRPWLLSHNITVSDRIIIKLTLPRATATCIKLHSANLPKKGHHVYATVQSW